MQGVKIMHMIIPAFLKSSLMIGLLIGTNFLGDIILLLFICINFICFEVIGAIASKCRKVSLTTILSSVFVIVAYALNLLENMTIFDLRTYIFVLVTGTICTISFYYFHSKCFEMYDEDVDGIIAK